MPAVQAYCKDDLVRSVSDCGDFSLRLLAQHLGVGLQLRSIHDEQFARHSRCRQRGGLLCGNEGKDGIFTFAAFPRRFTFRPCTDQPTYVDNFHHAAGHRRHAEGIANKKWNTLLPCYTGKDFYLSK